MLCNLRGPSSALVLKDAHANSTRVRSKRVLGHELWRAGRLYIWLTPASFFLVHLGSESGACGEFAPLVLPENLIPKLLVNHAASQAQS